MTLAAYTKTLALVAVVLFFLLPKGGGTSFVFALLFFIVWALYNVVRLILKPAERRPRAIRLAIWSATLVAAGATQAHWENASREQASEVVNAVLAHKSRTGSYPASPDEAGINGPALKDEWRIAYRLREGKPELSYPASFMPLTTYEYDFEARQWKTSAY